MSFFQGVTKVPKATPSTFQFNSGNPYHAFDMEANPASQTMATEAQLME